MKYYRTARRMKKAKRIRRKRNFRIGGRRF